MKSIGTAVTVLVLAGNALAASAQTVTLAPELWDRPRSGPAVAARSEMRDVVNAWLARPGARLVVHHGRDQESLLQAEELRGWLIALAIEAESIVLRNDLSTADPLRIEVVRD